MTNHFIDMQNADVVMTIGSNAAENHPITARWIQKAQARGTVILNADPRYTRTSYYADVFARFRSGTDIAFVGGIINYALQNDFIQKEYVRHYTNASFIVNSRFAFHDGLFSGYDPQTRQYDKSTWAFELDGSGVPRKDRTLEHPRCVYQLMKRHFSRYDIDAVCNITGTDREAYRRICEIYTSTWAPDRVGTWLYAMGTTQHTHGTQNIRTYCILQLLLGNIGLAGGGVNALRGESNVQGSTDHCLLFHILPGYLKSPVAADQTYADYLEHWTPKSNDPQSANWWQHTPKYITSLLKAWWGENAEADNGFCFDYLPRRSGNYSHISLFEAMYADQIKGLILFGQNPAVSGPNANMERQAMQKLDWMVAVDLWETETSRIWNLNVDPEQVQTEVFLLPACSSVEKEGSITASGRWAQWRYQAVPPLGDSKSDLWILDRLYKSVRAEYEKGGVFPEPILQLAWDYGTGEEPDVHQVAREINGYFRRDATVGDREFKKGQQVPSFAFLTDDGATCSGNWLYCGSYTDAGNMMARRSKEDATNDIGLFPNWSWCWPVNRRILYNRASVDPQGRPWSPARWVIRWNAATRKWEGDVPDGGWPPGTRHPFIMRPEGHGELFAISLADGPLPEHYEPVESPIANPMSSQQVNPAVKIWDTEGVDLIGRPDQFPIVATTYRVTEHWQAGAMSRNLPWLAELVPDVFVEIGRSLAERKGIASGDRVVVSSARGSMEAYALVTERFQPFHVDGRQVDQIGIPWHFGPVGLARGDSANVLTPHAGDANTMIPEFKAFLCDLVKKEVA